VGAFTRRSKFNWLVRGSLVVVAQREDCGERPSSGDDGHSNHYNPLAAHRVTFVQKGAGVDPSTGDRFANAGSDPSGAANTFRSVEAIERRAFFLALIVTIVFAFAAPGFTTPGGRGWEVTLYILGLLALAAGASLLALAVMPQGVVDFTRERRERLLFIAFALAMAALVDQVLLRAYGTYWGHKHGTSF
jgi:hypothetical protein